MQPELMEVMLLIGNRDVALLNSGNRVMVLREPYADLDEPAELTALFQGQLGVLSQQVVQHSS